MKIEQAALPSIQILILNLNILFFYTVYVENINRIISILIDNAEDFWVRKVFTPSRKT